MTVFVVSSVVLCAVVAMLALFMRRIFASPSLQKAIAVACMFSYLAAYYLARPAISGVVGLGGDASPFGEQKFLCAVVLVLAWFSAALVLLAAMHRFTAFAAVESILKFVGTPVVFVNVVMLKWNLQGIIGESTTALAYVQAIAYALYSALFLWLCAMSWVENRKVSWNANRFWIAFGWFWATVAVSFQSYSFIALFGPAKEYVKIGAFTVFHRMMIYGAMLFLIALFILLRKMDKKIIRHVLLYISFSSLMISLFNYTSDVFAQATYFPLALPLGLCQLVLLLLPLCLIFNIQWICYLAFFFNTATAFTAMLMPAYGLSTNLFDPALVIFWVNQICAFCLPLLMVVLGEFERPKQKHFLNALAVFAGYYVLILFLNAWFSNYGAADFFVNAGGIVNKLGKWVEDTRQFSFSFTLAQMQFAFYPLYQALYFVFYVLFTVLAWMLYQQCFNVADLYSDIFERSRKIKVDRLALKSQLGGRSMEEPLYMQETELLVLDHVRKRYGSSSVYAVKDANLTVCGGEIFGFLGPNGAGKSTIIKSIVGIQPITDGQIRVCGYDAMRQPVEAKRQLGFVPDHYELYENLTGREYINYIADLYRVSAEERTERIDRYVALFHLEGSFDNPMKTYSHGMKQKIAIMAALVHNPKIWILDEPLTGLDPDSIFQVKECMKQHAKEGNIVFFSSHIIDVVERICDRIAIIRKGEILTCRTMKEIEESGIGLENFYMKTIEYVPQEQPVSEAQKV